MTIVHKRIIADASRLSGLDAFGDPSFEEGLEILVSSIGKDSDLPQAARVGAEARLIGLLEQRLRLYADRARYSEIAEQEIQRPLVVIGMPRSGTTFLHALLAQDPAARSPLTWQIGQLSPPPMQETIDIDPRIAATTAAQATLPENFKLMHMVGATLPDECNAILSMAFFSPNFDASWNVRSYMDWFVNADARPRYALHRDVLQHLQAFTTGDHWVLKAPPHMFHMNALIDTYPDANIVFPHRDPASTLPSLVSLLATIRSWTYGQVDRAAIGREQLELWAIAIERTLAFRGDPAQATRFIDVSYESLIATPLHVVRSIYDHFGLDMTPSAEAAMKRFLVAKPKDRHGAHHYTLEDAGLTRSQVHDRFADYMNIHFASHA